MTPQEPPILGREPGSISGLHPVVTQNTPVPLWLAWGAVVLAAAGAATAAVDHSRLQRLEQDAIEMRVDAKAVQSGATQQKTELVELKADVKYVKEGVERIERRLARGTRTAGGRDE